MAVKNKGVLANFLKPSTHYKDNQQNFRSIFIDKNEDDLKLAPEDFLEASFNTTPSQTQLEHNGNTSGTQNTPSTPKVSEPNIAPPNDIGTQLGHNKNTSGTQITPSTPKVSEPNIAPPNDIGTQLGHDKNTSGTQITPSTPKVSEPNIAPPNDIGTQLGHDKNTSGILNPRSRTQMEHNENIKDTKGTQLEHPKEHDKEHIRNTSGTQHEHKRIKYGLSFLTGIQKQVLTLFYQSCKRNRSQITEEFSLIYIANTLQIKQGSVKTSLRRLEDKKFIKSVQFKKGRGGWTQFELPDNVYREFLERDKIPEWNTNGIQMEHKSDTFRSTERNTTPLSSSSLNKITTTKLSDEWNFEIKPYYKFGFTYTQLKQLASLNSISAVDVEQSLIEFNHDFENNMLPQIKTNNINFLMGLFRQGNVYVSESFRNEEEAIISEMARRSETKRKKLLEDKFEAWIATWEEEEKNKVIQSFPPHLISAYKAFGIENKDVKKLLFDVYLNKCST